MARSSAQGWIITSGDVSSDFVGYLVNIVRVHPQDYMSMQGTSMLYLQPNHMVQHSTKDPTASAMHYASAIAQDVTAQEIFEASLEGHGAFHRSVLP